MTKRVLITGGVGFVGHHLVEHILRTTDWHIVTLDRLDTSSTLNRLAEVCPGPELRQRLTVVFHDLRSAINPSVSYAIREVDYVFHLAAASHVDRSIVDPMDFVQNNVVGTCNLLEYVRSVGCERMLYFSTDEVFGPAKANVRFREWDRYRSGNPYAATKAGAEELCVAYANTYGMPILITHTMNVIGERQNVEKFVPSTVRKVLLGEEVLVHASPEGVPGSRFYIHARNVSAAALYVMAHGSVGEKYNIVGEKEVDNLTLAQSIASHVGKPLRHRLLDFHSSRPGHDLRYALDGTRLAELGFTMPVEFDQSLARVVRWTLEHPQWLKLDAKVK